MSKTSISTKSNIVNRPSDVNFAVSSKKTNIPQRTKQEQTILNLCSFLKIPIIYKELDTNMNVYYCPDHKSYDFQSASNTILQLSESLNNN